MRAQVIDLAKDFSKYPAGRYTSDGPFSGEAFRRKFLEPALREHHKIRVKLDGALGYGSSFLDEAFAGLVRQGTISSGDFSQLIELESSNKSLLVLISRYVKEASHEDGLANK